MTPLAEVVPVLAPAAAALAIVSLVFLIYLYAGYPALLWIGGLVRPRPVRCDERCDDVTPFLTVLIPAHNEAGVIEEKVRNTLAAEYPADRLEVLVLSDGSTDDTADRVRALVTTDADGAAGSERAPAASVRVLDLPRMGKGRALNAGAAAACGDVLVLTDANIALAPGALRALARNFADPDVGGVCGDKRYAVDPAGSGRDAARLGEGSATAKGEGLYWRYDRWVKRLESRVGSIFASDGALHAVRSELYRPIRNPASADDMAISMRVVLQGFRLVYEPRAEAFETPPEDATDEFRRKIRVTNHSMRALLDLGPALWTSGFYSVQLLSHKLFRHLSPLLLVGMLGGSAISAAAGVRPMQHLLALQLVLYALALGGHFLRGCGAGRLTLLAAPYHFALIQAAALGGIASLVRGRRLAIWTPRGGLEAG